MSNLYNTFKLLGLTKLETEIYVTLKKIPNSTARILSIKLNKPLESVHRSLKNLKDKCFISESNDFPKKYNIIPLKSVYSDKIQGLNNLFKQLLTESREEISLTKSSLIKYIPDRETHHKIGEDLFRKLEKEVLIIASGTGDFKPSFFEAMVRISEAGKTHKIIVTSFNESNIEKLRIWEKNGIQIRYKKGKDINMIIYDRNIVQLSVRVMEGSKEKEGFLIENSTLASFLAEFYSFLWKKSKRVI